MKTTEEIRPILIAGFTISISYAQTNSFPSSGSVGVGTLSPGMKMEIASTAPYTFYLSGYAPSLYWGGTSGTFPNSSANSATAFIGFSSFAGAYSQEAGDLNIATQSFNSSNSSGISFLVPSNDSGSYSTTPAMRINRTGYVEIELSAPQARLGVTDAVATSGAIAIFNAPNLSNGNRLSIFLGRNYGTTLETAHIGFTPSVTATLSTLNFGFYGNGDLLNLQATGNVGIGTKTPSHKLAVNGTIRAKEVIVDTGWADYVFAKDYRLAPLAEVQSHIEEKGHLPGIPSATEVARDGVSMADMQTRMLAKMEEPTLHLIAQEKRIQRLESENAALRLY